MKRYERAKKNIGFAISYILFLFYIFGTITQTHDDFYLFNVFVRLWLGKVGDARSSKQTGSIEITMEVEIWSSSSETGTTVGGKQKEVVWHLI